MGGGPGPMSRVVPSLRSGGGYPMSGLGGYPISGPGGYPISGPGGGTPSQVQGGYPISGLGRYPISGPGYPPRQISIASSFYVAGGMPLAFTQEDFLVLFLTTGDRCES